MRRICIAFGTRPETSKMAPVIYAVEKHIELEPIIFVTGQHREQLNSMLKFFNVQPDYNLDVMQSRQSLNDLIGRIVPLAGRKLKEINPDYVLVHGDTLTTFAIGLAAYFENIPVAHVEAGLRSHTLAEPFPEEANRRLTDVLTSLDLPPTIGAKKNLLNEGKEEGNIIVTGNTAVDAVKYVAKQAELPNRFKSFDNLITVTMHRRENLSVMTDLAESLAKIARKYKKYTFIYPVHLNPKVREAVWGPLSNISNVILEDPWNYQNMIALLAKSELIITDSGGIQEEGAALGVPVVVLRNVTERPEGVDLGVLKLVGNEAKQVYVTIDELLGESESLTSMKNHSNPYGDGKAGVRIAQAVAWRLGLDDKPVDWQVK